MFTDHLPRWLLTATFAIASNVQATPMNWVDWSSYNATTGTGTGTVIVGGTTINVSLTGTPGMIFDLVDGDYYYNNSGTGFTDPSGTYLGMKPSDLLRASQTGTVEITFDKPVDTIYMAMVSVGAPWASVTYGFQNSFNVLSSGGNYWGTGSWSTAGTNFTGVEYNGILEFPGTFTSMSFEIKNAEYWHGFNLGFRQPVTVPEPGTLLLLSGGLFMLSRSRRASPPTSQQDRHHPTLA